MLQLFSLCISQFVFCINRFCLHGLTFGLASFTPRDSSQCSACMYFTMKKNYLTYMQCASANHIIEDILGTFVSSFHLSTRWLSRCDNNNYANFTWPFAYFPIQKGSNKLKDLSAFYYQSILSTKSFVLRSLSNDVIITLPFIT